MKNILKKIFKVSIYCIGFGSLNIVMQFLVYIPYTFLYVFFSAGPQLQSEDSIAVLSAAIQEAARSTLMPVLLSAGILTFGLAWLVHVLSGRNFFERLSFNRTDKSLIASSFFIGLSLQIPVNDLIITAERANVMPDLLKKYDEIMESMMTGQNFILEIAVIGILVPILEEIIYRGLIFDQLRKNIPLVPALIIQALIFGAAHLNIVQGSYAFLLALLMGIALVRSRSILLPVAIHIGMNLSAVVLSEFQHLIGDTAELILRTSSYVLAILCIAFMLYGTRNNKTAEM